MSLFPNRKLILLFAVLLWFEFSLSPFFTVAGVKPGFLLIFLVFYTFRINWKRVASLAFLAGFSRDLLANSFFGLETASYVCGSILLRFLAGRFDRQKRWIQLASLFAFSWASLLLFSGFAFLVQEPYPLTPAALSKTFLASIYTVGLGAFLFPLLEKWFRFTWHEKQYELFSP